MEETKKAVEQEEEEKPCRRYVKHFEDRDLIITFAGKESITKRLICYAERKASLKF